MKKTAFTGPKTTPELTGKITEVFKGLEEEMLYLYNRWRDEHEYEDIRDYGARIAKQLPADFVLIKMNKRPFGFDFTAGTTAVYQVKVTASTYGWQRIA